MTCGLVSDQDEINTWIDYSNPGFRPVENVRLTDTLPAGSAFASATGGGSHAAGVVTWNLPPLAPGAAGSVSVTVTVAADGAYTNSARMWSSQLVVKAITSNSVTTVRDTVAPTVNIPVPPNVTATSDTTPSFVFTVVDAGAVATECRIDGTPFAPCTSPFTAAVAPDQRLPCRRSAGLRCRREHRERHPRARRRHDSTRDCRHSSGEWRDSMGLAATSPRSSCALTQAAQG